ncbi:MAG: putative DNA-binding domain-containing protein [Myxococcales bacterium]|nr:putative DNA-binding domain-containing protein [Myxococcales bacterium]
MNLDATFRLFHVGVTGARPLADTSPFVGDDRLDAGARLGIYRHAYRARLVGALRDLFPTLAAAVPDFDVRAEAWVASHPPAERSLFHIGQDFAEAFDGAARDLALLDHARRVVFDAPDDPPVSVETLSALPPDAWPTLRPRRVGPSRVLRLAHDPTVSPATEGPTTVLVWRVGATADVRHRALTPVETALVDALETQDPLAEILERLAGELGAEAVPALTHALAVAARDGWLALDARP